MQYTKEGWSGKPEPELLPFYNKRFELSHEDAILLCDSRIVILNTLRSVLLNDLQAEHQGIVRMKRLTRRYIWWPKMDQEVEEVARSCFVCQEAAKAPPSSQQAS